MIKGIKFASIPTTDQDRALRFWTEQVGFLVKTDQPFQDGQRWIELRVKGSDAGVVLFTPDAHKGMIGGFSNISFYSDNVEKTYEELKAKGVQFISEPAQRPYGIEAVFKDNSGNWFSLTQPTEGN